MATKYEKKAVETWLNEVDYEFKCYMPSDEALLFVNFIKEVNDGQEENETPIVHLKMMDNVFNKDKRCAILCHRGIGKTTVFAEYLILFIAAFGYLPGFGKVNLLLYVTDSIENGVKNLRRNVEFRYHESEFLQKLIPNQKITVGTDGAGYVDLDTYEEQVAGGRKFTDIRLEFMNNNGHRTIAKGYGAKTGVRGAKELGQRPTIALLDDLVSDEDARSDTIIDTIENTVYKAVSKALHPKKQKMIWLGTPFNAKDPLYKAVESGAWKVSVYPICEKFPVSRKDFRGSWEDRFDYDYVQDEYDEAMALHRPENFDQELMLRITSEEDRIVHDSDIVWYNRDETIRNKSNFNFYITTDFATSDTDKADFSVIMVWAYSNNGDWLLVDGVCKRQLMDANIDAVFRFVSIYKPLSVGIEINGQQKGFIQWLKSEMLTRNVFFNLAKQGKVEGIRRSTKKIESFLLFVPTITGKKIWFPKELENEILVTEGLEELRFATRDGFRSKHDDVADAMSMLLEMNPFKPSAVVKAEYIQSENGNFAHYPMDEDDIYRNSTVF